MTDNTRRCAHCDKTVESKNVFCYKTPGRSYYYCMVCTAERFKVCHLCKERRPNATVYVLSNPGTENKREQEHYVCVGCSDAMCVRCPFCKTRVIQKDKVGSETICGYCVVVLPKCYRCGTRKAHNNNYVQCDSFDVKSGYFCGSCLVKPVPDTKFVRNTSSRLVGVELEFIAPRSAYIKELREYGVVKPDGSVRGSNGVGKEFNTFPARGDALLELLIGATAVMRAAGCFVNQTCGCHVHLDMHGTGKEQKANLHKWWGVFEFLIMGLVNENRWDNPFCVRDAYESFRSRRYKTLNLDALTRYGTYEVRLHHGTVNDVELKNWVLFLLSFFDTFMEIELTKKMEMEVLSLKARDQVAFLMAQTKMGMTMRKNILTAIKRNKYPEAIKAISKRKAGVAAAPPAPTPVAQEAPQAAPVALTPATFSRESLEQALRAYTMPARPRPRQQMPTEVQFGRSLWDDLAVSRTIREPGARVENEPQPAREEDNDV